MIATIENTIRNKSNGFPPSTNSYKNDETNSLTVIYNKINN